MPRKVNNVAVSKFFPEGYVKRKKLNTYTPRGGQRACRPQLFTFGSWDESGTASGDEATTMPFDFEDHIGIPIRSLTILLV